MRLLVIDTATQALSVALLEDGAPIGRFHEIVGRGHAEALLPAIAALPEGGRADAIAVDVGPGSFTGVRIGVAAARALALAWNIPLHGYSAPSMIAARAGQAHDEVPLIVTITGGHGELFWQSFEKGGLISTSDIASTPITLLAERIDAATIFGTGAEALVTARGAGAAISLYPDASDYPLIADLPPLPPIPIYGRGADAKTMAERAAP
ncbi:tRNA (adenosine(37)-N6)-threonylcarbamoyltransferase complex dimerization subunit type 1 TsaB [Sphingobium lactosutens]|uniref:tRNA (adenosine(37)-N6)-threonylcarbamoyltransferase complex dimerization subunit type 1 TsaB n=1 Tax=Sphingobium lactosutens TaxID=522773 RepID=UPI0015BB3C1E|nr:tRNA (adenosine(37)-N6)-threonylcarbamoyltransferase complex dimerization subunit type 1 TsaB [Sphingobium lactosutens]NWK98623.1 tRNA (adenosine(37)-N6)-threonylcarbamoyltransferase complex dimerization subunit type 1 TsaB [Sphingobium lactosutens]